MLLTRMLAENAWIPWLDEAVDDIAVSGFCSVTGWCKNKASRLTPELIIELDHMFRLVESRDLFSSKGYFVALAPHDAPSYSAIPDCSHWFHDPQFLRQIVLGS
jgi:hypothetical protein